MKNRIRLVIILKNVLFLTCLFIVLTASKCENEGGPVCEVVINSPATGTIFSENDNISLSASLEYYSPAERPLWEEPVCLLSGVRWTSDIDGVISTESYAPARIIADHSFSTDGLTLGIHTIKCYAVDFQGEGECVDEISIKIDEEDDNGNDDGNDNGVLQGNWDLLSIEDVPENYTYSGSWEFKSDNTYHWVFWMKDEVNNYIYNYDGNGTYLLSDDKLFVTGIVAETVIEGTPEDYMIIDYGQDNSSGSVIEYFSFPDDEGDEWVYTR